MSNTRAIRDEIEREAWFTFLREREFPFTVSFAKTVSRSQQQNRLVHQWFGQIARETGDTAAEIKALCKLRYGLPIMQARYPEWVAEHEPMYGPLPYLMRLKLFEYLPLTSKLRVKDMTEFMDAVQREYRAQGIHLTDPEARKYEEEFA